MKTTKLLAILMSLVMITALFAGCNTDTSGTDSESSAGAQSSQQSTPPAQKKAVNVIGLKGPTALGMVKLMKDGEQNTAQNDYHFTVVGAPDEITSKLINGEVDIAAVPTNLAATLYNKTEGGVTILALNTLGVLYLLQKGETIASVADLKGKTIYATGEGSTPQYALEFVLRQNGLDPQTDVQIIYRQEHAEILPLMNTGEATIALLPQPFVAQALAKVEGLAVALDWTEEWQKSAGNDSQLTMGCVVARTAFLQENKDAVDAFLEEYKNSVSYVNQNVAEAAKLSGEYDIIPTEVAEKAIPECNIVFYESQQMKDAAEGFFKVLFESNPQAVGGKLPDEAIYYQR